ncbi:uncharacterized protein [Arachis hypogaea]|uniref:uncharacterized protein n=1 Tax=Arachis hypogaea TaxID=3818 RepID=UPI003B223026
MRRCSIHNGSVAVAGGGRRLCSSISSSANMERLGVRLQRLALGAVNSEVLLERFIKERKEKDPDVEIAVFKGLYDNVSNNTHVGAHLAILTAIRDVCKLAVKELTSWVIYSEEERKFNKDITVGLIRSELLNLTEYNVHMAKLIDGGETRLLRSFLFLFFKCWLLRN